MSVTRIARIAFAGAVVGIFAASGGALAQGTGIEHATLGEAGAKTAEVSTAELRRILAEGSAIVLDARKRSEYALSHIPGARSVAPAPGEKYDGFVAAVEKLVGGDKAQPLVLYCNGPHCQASRRLAEQLAAAGYTKVRRYQLGIPVWRALGGATEIEREALIELHRRDRSGTVFLDARPAEDYAAGSVAGAHSVPAASLASGGLLRALEAGLLPRDDFNARIVVYGRDAGDARAVAEALTHSAFHNVAYYAGGFASLAASRK